MSMTLTLVVVFARGGQNFGYLWLVTDIFLKSRYAFQLECAMQPCLVRECCTISAVFCVVRSVREFYFRFVTN
jgi:hypothetical protein